jgi:ubiquinone/menaquinone biosynthesis C-methylase UbiE
LERTRRYYDRSAPSLERKKRASRLDAVETSRILEYVPSTATSVLDVGCGTGHLLDQIGSERKVGVDLSISMLKIARDRGCPAQLILADGGRLPFRDRSFTSVISQDTIVHFKDPMSMTREMVRTCARGGRIIITGSKTTFFSRLVSYYARLHLRVYLRSFSLKELEKIFEFSGAHSISSETIGSSVILLLATPRYDIQG